MLHKLFEDRTLDFRLDRLKIENRIGEREARDNLQLHDFLKHQIAQRRVITISRQQTCLLLGADILQQLAPDYGIDVRVADDLGDGRFREYININFADGIPDQDA